MKYLYYPLILGQTNPAYEMDDPLALSRRSMQFDVMPPVNELIHFHKIKMCWQK